MYSVKGIFMALTEMECGNRDFIRCTLAEIIIGKDQMRHPKRPSLFSPFGLGVLDLALSDYVY